MSDREQFEAYVTDSGRSHLLERDFPYDGYIDLAVSGWWQIWQASRAALLDQPVVLTDTECEQIADIINMNRQTLDPRIYQVRPHKHSSHWVDCSEEQFNDAKDTPRRRIVYAAPLANTSADARNHDKEHIKALQNALVKAIDAQAPVAPERWKLVPVDATDAMIHAVMAEDSPGYRFKRSGIEAQYRLMVDAAPIASALLAQPVLECVGYYWIGEDNRQKFCGSYDTIDIETAMQAEKVYRYAAPALPAAQPGEKS